MISDLIGTTTDVITPHEPRLTMKPDAELGGLVDGAWWPRSTDPGAEFPPLIAALESYGPIRRVSYHLDAWPGAGRRLTVGDQVVRMEGFHSAQPDTVTLIRSDHSRIRLVVVPPGTPGGAARAVLRSASTSNATTTVEELLTGNGVGVISVPQARKPFSDDVSRWETEGGATRTVSGPAGSGAEPREGTRRRVRIVRRR